MKVVVKWLVGIALVSGMVLAWGGVAHADGGAPNLAYVAGTGQGISVIDIAQQKVTDSLTVEGKPDTILLSVDGRLLYVTQPDLNRLTVIAPKNKEVACTATVEGGPSLLALDPGTDTLYVAGPKGKTVLGLEPLTCKVKQTLHVNGSVNGLAIAVIGLGLTGGSGNEIWVADSTSLHVFNADGKEVGRVSLPEEPQYLCIPSGPTVYLTTKQGSVMAVDIKTRSLLGTLIKGGPFGPMDYNAATSQIFVPEIQQNRIQVLAPVASGMELPKQPKRSITFPAAPESIAITSDGQLGFVALQNGSVAMLDISARQEVKTFQVGGAPRFIITGLYPSLISLTPQQSSFLNILINSTHYIAIAVIIIVTLLLMRRTKLRNPLAKKEKE